MGLPVVIVGMGGGFTYGNNGSTHHGIDDVALMRAMPGMTVVCPCDIRETAAAIDALVELGKPAYLRLAKATASTLPGTDMPFKLGVPNVLRLGRDVVLAAAGPIAHEALQAATLLEADGLDCEVISVHTAKPLDNAIAYLNQQAFRTVFVIEEHGPCGGMAEGLMALLAAEPHRPTVVSITAPDRFVHETGSQVFLRRLVGLEAQAIAQRVRDTLEERP